MLAFIGTKVLTNVSLSGSCTIFIFISFMVSLAAFLASPFVLYVPSISIHGRVSLIFIHAEYNFFTDATCLGWMLDFV